MNINIKPLNFFRFVSQNPKYRQMQELRGFSTYLCKRKDFQRLYVSIIKSQRHYAIYRIFSNKDLVFVFCLDSYLYVT